MTETHLVEEKDQNGGTKLRKNRIEESFLDVDAGLLTGLQKTARVLETKKTIHFQRKNNKSAYLPLLHYLKLEI